MKHTMAEPECGRNVWKECILYFYNIKCIKGIKCQYLKKKRYIKVKPLISSLLWNLHHENISFRSKVIDLLIVRQ
jgi:hypothetical protein